MSGKLDTTRTVKQLGLDDEQPFRPREEKATLEQLMAGRSGIYLDLPDDDFTQQQPMRGSVDPGTYFSYNNWEFDAAGTAFEKVTGLNIYDALQAKLAVPLGMQDFDRKLQHKYPSPGSIHPEYAMYLSTRDMAHIGLLMFNYGVWNGKPLVDVNWIRYSTSVITPWDEMNPPVLRLRGNPERRGFGSAWWVWDAPVFAGNISASPMQGAYEARGTGGQFITVIPTHDLVLVQKVDIDKDPTANMTDWGMVTQMVIAAQCPRGKCGDAK